MASDSTGGDECGKEAVVKDGDGERVQGDGELEVCVCADATSEATRVEDDLSSPPTWPALAPSPSTPRAPDNLSSSPRPRYHDHRRVISTSAALSALLESPSSW
ncbi:hypothetical protein Dda_3008 [Drechslerella dactyloides]|uniref:Uncharacterized protein n=1 Tax=Drechslerella dactyloides TaxID=74499 RepID=A0AAD6J0N7_DREDA|nr:hypothetical protein Dda_3008 [Drechslerella dactyloides]